jgi:hypothetical protein
VCGQTAVVRRGCRFEFGGGPGPQGFAFRGHVLAALAVASCGRVPAWLPSGTAGDQTKRRQGLSSPSNRVKCLRRARRRSGRSERGDRRAAGKGRAQRFRERGRRSASSRRGRRAQTSHPLDKQPAPASRSFLVTRVSGSPTRSTGSRRSTTRASTSRTPSTSSATSTRSAGSSSSWTPCSALSRSGSGAAGRSAAVSSSNSGHASIEPRRRRAATARRATRQSRWMQKASARLSSGRAASAACGS